eukprot:TRINITY_DN11725_c0_g3_i1.p1 TRINITY_DN11725_c0_g3~~TRINITY_DN11725_c0_g3_i1.p1  ORF type:complete len:821 (+),score=124.57 TRINITY_DN11725_c0_g3_i1:87-2465(+)
MLAAAAVDPGPIIVTTTGPLRGRKNYGSEVVSYYGIPFAEPPVGSLRFQKAVKHGGWNGTLDAHAVKPPCWQPDKFKAILKVDGFDEDCLYMNAHSPPPRADGELRPVVVEIHGGAFQCLRATKNGRQFAEQAGAVWFAMQYRLGVLGFLATSNPPENFGMQDQVLALQWIRENAKAFGGDPNKVLIMGGSGGAAAVAGHLTMPASYGLYQSAVLRSPGGHQGWQGPTDGRVRQDDDWMSPNLALKDSFAFAQEVGCSGLDDMSCLQQVPPHDLIIAATVSPTSRKGRWFFSAALPEEDMYPLGEIAKGNWNRVPLMVGISSCERCPMAFSHFGPPDTPVSQEEFRKRIHRWGLTGERGSQIGPDTVESWYSSRIASLGYWKAYEHILADSAWACQGFLHASAVVAGGQDKGLYFYYYNYTPADHKYPGVQHGFPDQFFFGSRWKPTDAEEAMMGDLVQMIGGLASSGNPNENPQVSAKWPTFNGGLDESILFIDVPNRAVRKSLVDRPECHNWKPFFGWLEENHSTITQTTTYFDVPATTEITAGSWNYVFGEDGANECPKATSILSKEACMDVPEKSAGEIVAFKELTVAGDPKGCFRFGVTAFFNNHEIGAGRLDRFPICGNCASTTETTSIMPSRYVFGQDGANGCPEATSALSKEVCKDVPEKSIGRIVAFKELTVAGDPKGCFRYGVTAFFNNHAIGAGRIGRFPICGNNASTSLVTAPPAPPRSLSSHPASPIRVAIEDDANSSFSAPASSTGFDSEDEANSCPEASFLFSKGMVIFGYFSVVWS